MTENSKKILYTITDGTFPSFDVYESPNGWWREEKKVQALINAFKARSSIKMACAHVGISRDQYYYFVELHPDFETVKENCEQGILLRAMNTVNGDAGNPTTARWIVKNLHPDFNPKLEKENQREKKEDLKINIPTEQTGAAIITDKELAESFRQLSALVLKDTEAVNEIMREVAHSDAYTPLTENEMPTYMQNILKSGMQNDFVYPTLS